MENRIEIINDITYLEIIEDKTTLEIVEEIVDIVDVAVQGPPGLGIPIGGQTNQILIKKSDSDYDLVWAENPEDTIQKKYDINNNGIIDEAEHSLISDDSVLFNGRPITDFYDAETVNILTARYTYTQSIADSDWIITHNLGRFPSGVTVVDSAGSVIEGAVQFINNNSIKISFNYAFSGKAYIG